MSAPVRVVGVLLAAGRGERFGAAKLRAPLPEGRSAGVPVGVAALRNLKQAVGDVVAVVRPGDTALAEALRREGADVAVAERAGEGMGASLAAGVAATPAQAGIVVALADMPWVEPATIARVAAAIAAGASLAAPFCNGARGHPVGFAPRHRDALLALRGDEGARAVLAAHAADIARVDVDDAGVLRDVDTPADLH
jgi:molybdenum cofactor cytidylyltransferase